MESHVFISGRPGVGKTTLIKKIILWMEREGIPFSGFITEEIREHGKRTGFKIINLSKGEEAILALRDHPSPVMVGRYGVLLENFEKVGIAALQADTPFLIIDEIGSMELASRKFKLRLKELLRKDSPHIVATIGLKHLSLLKERGVKLHLFLELEEHTRDEVFIRVRSFIERWKRRIEASKSF